MLLFQYHYTEILVWILLWNFYLFVSELLFMSYYSRVTIHEKKIGFVFWPNYRWFMIVTLENKCSYW